MRGALAALVVLLPLAAACEDGGTGSARPPVPETRPQPTCPPSGVEVRKGTGDAAMGLRTLNIDLVNCGNVPITLNGHPRVTLLDAAGKPVPATVRKGSGGVSTVEAFDKPPTALTVRPGGTATASLLWRNLVTDGTRPAVTAPSVTVVPKPGMPAVRVDGMAVDLGTTTKVGVSPWRLP
ncbi:hypothetical protein GCM10009678_32140 [Actinomadura kijaniata]|uniref:Uncharacterized protein GlcG (DUF336 family) n=1 Tax=Actinomadura namibiensis TaxID=182080 RepID=A0A7W3LIC5_ACTNM|nr:DUF4232 domain-containing protein [Actinomadura namibiensis]MBA8948645.1 uncharacterized protein GlcG (DUF336 family) [Actinomadura namibiensis]